MSLNLNESAWDTERCDARALQRRLYREIGVSAVALALVEATTAAPATFERVARHTPAILREEDRAA